MGSLAGWSETASAPSPIGIIIILQILLVDIIVLEDRLALLLSQVVSLFTHTAKK